MGLCWRNATSPNRNRVPPDVWLVLFGIPFLQRLKLASWLTETQSKRSLIHVAIVTVSILPHSAATRTARYILTSWPSNYCKMTRWKQAAQANKGTTERRNGFRTCTYVRTALAGGPFFTRALRSAPDGHGMGGHSSCRALSHG